MMRVSGILFSLILGGMSIKIMHDLMTRELGLRELAAGGWRGYIREGQYNVEVHVSLKGDEVLLLLPDKSIPEEVCKKVVQRLAAKLHALVSLKEMTPESVEVVGPANSFCYYCLEPVYMPFRCNRCGGYFCEEHRLPEKHDCPGDQEEKEGAAIKKPEEQKEEKEKRIVVRVIACG